ncbi:MAG: orotidine-5'-phosphate decarboxylase [Patiriisocius sp.]
MTRKQLIQQIQEKKTVLCVGLDPDIDKVPKSIAEKENWIFEFNKAIVDATHEYCVAYKPNTAFYESYGSWGWQQFELTVDYIRKNYPKHFVIADAKRGDIGNTSSRYAKAFFEAMDCHGVTVAPYMGEDSVAPFLQFADRWVILLVLTSNKGSQDFQGLGGDKKLYQEVISKAKAWGNPENLMFVAGATRGEELKKVREEVGDHFLLIPGVGAQGGDLESVMKNTLLDNGDAGILINSSRGIIYASQADDFAEAAGLEARKLSALIKDLM